MCPSTVFQDYHNLAGNVSHRHGVPLPPVQPAPTLAVVGPRRIRAAPVQLPKTFTTRKGALLLFSEDFMESHEDGDGVDGDGQQSGEKADFRTVENFAKSILSYGSKVIMMMVYISDIYSGPSILRPPMGPRKCGLMLHMVLK